MKRKDLIKLLKKMAGIWNVTVVIMMYTLTDINPNRYQDIQR